MRFPIRFDRWYSVLSSLLFLPSKDAYIDINGGTVVVRMGWAFDATFRCASVSRTSTLDSFPISRGVHGFGGRWLVNGAGDRVAVLDLTPTQRARVLGIPVDLKQLLVSVDDPEALGASLMRS